VSDKKSLLPSNAEEAIGYGRPPFHKRFQPGHSGNPKGRPKGSRTVGAVLRDILRQKIPITGGGKRRLAPAIEVILLRLLNDALRGEHKAIKLLLTLLDQYGNAPEASATLDHILAEDEAILARYLPKTVDTASGAPANEEDVSDENADDQ
jgi:hypothetical protein